MGDGAVDGIAYTRWTSEPVTDNTPDQWLALDLDEDHTIDSVVTVWPVDYENHPRRYQLQSLDESGAGEGEWTTHAVVQMPPEVLEAARALGWSPRAARVPQLDKPRRGISLWMITKKKTSASLVVVRRPSKKFRNEPSIGCSDYIQLCTDMYERLQTCTDHVLNYFQSYKRENKSIKNSFSRRI